MSNTARDCIVLAATQDIMFSAGTLLANLAMVQTGLDADILLFVDRISEQDRAAMRRLHPSIEIREYQIPEEFRFEDVAVRGAWVVRSSQMGFSRFECFLLLTKYENILWLDTDLVVRGDLSELVAWGSQTSSMKFVQQAVGTAGSNFTQPVSNYDMARPTLNSGVMVIGRSLSNPEQLRTWLYGMAKQTAAIRKGTDQGILNLMLQEFQLTPELLPTKYNYVLPHAALMNPPCTRESVVIAHGASRDGKFWNSLKSLSLFPEWLVYYRRWLEVGGSAFRNRRDAAAFTGYLLDEELARLPHPDSEKPTRQFLGGLRQLIRSLRRTVDGSHFKQLFARQELRLVRLEIDTYLTNASASPPNLGLRE